jgi:hypothetical protein
MRRGATKQLSGHLELGDIVIGAEHFGDKPSPLRSIALR